METLHQNNTKKVKLSEIAKLKTGLPLNRKKGEEFEYRVLSLKCFEESKIFLEEECLDKFKASEKLDNYLAKEGDIVVRLREPIEALYIQQEVLVPSTMVIITPKKEINSIFLTYYLNTKFIKKALYKDIEGSLIRMVGVKDLKKIFISLPSYETQKKIVSLFTLIDKEIKLLSKLQEEKKLLKEKILERLSDDKK